MASRSKASEARSIIEKVDFNKFLIMCEDFEMEKKAANALQDIMTKGKNSERLQAIELFFKYKYGNPKQQTDITSGGHPINSVSFDILENDSSTRE